MCVYSMIEQHRYDKWNELPYISPLGPPNDFTSAQRSILNLPTQAELDEFRELLERAREYDRRNGEPECASDEKREKLLELAREFSQEFMAKVQEILDET